MNDKDRNKVNRLIDIYQNRVNNIQWHIDTNEPKDAALERCKNELKHNKEFLTDLKSLISPYPIL